MIGDNYLRVQRWKPNFIVDRAEINTFPVWIRFPVLPVECYTKGWIKRAGNSIGRTIKIDVATLLASRGILALVCVEVDLQRPLKLGYHMRGDSWRLQYEGLHDICFECGRHGHRVLRRPDKETWDKEPNGTENRVGLTSDRNGPVGRFVLQPSGAGEETNSRYGEWISVQCNHRRYPRKAKGDSGSSSSDLVAGRVGGD